VRTLVPAKERYPSILFFYFWSRNWWNGRDISCTSCSDNCTCHI